MGHKKSDFLKIWFLIFLIGGLGFGLFTMIKNNTRPQQQEKPVEIVEEVKGDAQTVDCIHIEPLVQNIVDSASLDRKWYLKEYGDSEILLEVENTDISSADTKFLTPLYTVGDITKKMVYSQESDKWIGKVNLNDLEVGNHTLVLSVDIKDCEFKGKKELPFTLSYPVYVTWTLDWEGTDVKQSNLDRIVNISSKYGIPVTHFFNPYIYYSTSANRSKTITNWILNRKNAGDSIGLHLHMYEKYVRAAGVIPKQTYWGYDGYGKGYDTPTVEYSYEEFMKILALAKSDFSKHGLDTPTIYRAGGWFANEEILRALEDSGFIADSSGRTPYKIGKNNLTGPWNLSTTTQPYILNREDQNNTANPNTKLWEVPNNGLDSWSFNASQMIGAFKENYSGDVSGSTKVVTYLSHPQGFEHDNPILHEVFTEISKYTYKSDSGPVIFITIDKLPMLSENR